jgi:5'-3' exonuclease
VKVLYCGRGVAKLEVMDDASVQTKYGVPASGYADFAALRGDPSDGLPGVAGVGEKTAARLIARHGDLDGLLTALDDPSSGFAPGLKAKLVAGREYLVKARQVVRVAVDAPVPPVDCTMPREPVDAERLFALAEKWGLASPAKRMVDALSG